MSQSLCGHKPPTDDCDFCREAERDTEPQEARFHVHSFEAPAHWASALINGDLTGLDYYGPECVAEFEAWQALHPTLYVVDCSNESHIGRWNGLQTELLTYSALTDTTKKESQSVE